VTPVEVPSVARVARPFSRIVSMGPPEGVSNEDCGTVQMLVETVDDAIPGFTGRAHFTYFRPTEAEMEALRNGGFIEVAQYGQGVQPFSVTVWDDRLPVVSK
jgi:hypothetical protein